MRGVDPTPQHVWLSGRRSLWCLQDSSECPWLDEILRCVELHEEWVSLRFTAARGFEPPFHCALTLHCCVWPLTRQCRKPITWLAASGYSTCSKSRRQAVECQAKTRDARLRREMPAWGWIIGARLRREMPNKAVGAGTLPGLQLWNVFVGFLHLQQLEVRQNSCKAIKSEYRFSRVWCGWTGAGEDRNVQLAWQKWTKQNQAITLCIAITDA